MQSLKQYKKYAQRVRNGIANEAPTLIVKDNYILALHHFGRMRKFNDRQEVLKDIYNLSEEFFGYMREHNVR